MRGIKLVAIIAAVVVLGLAIAYIYNVPGHPSAAIAAGATTQPQPSSLEQAQAALDADLAMLRQKGEPTQPADLTPPSVDDAENRAAELRAAAKVENFYSKAEAAYWAIEDSLAMPLAPEHADVIRAMLKENAPVLQLIQSAMAKGKVRWHEKYATPMIETLLPELADMRRLAMILRPAALLAHDDGDDLAALEHVRETLFLARAAGTDPFYVSHDVEIGLDANAADLCSTIAPTLEFGKVAAMPDQLRRTISDLLDETTARAHFRLALQAERVVLVDTALALASGKMTFDQISALAGPDKDSTRRRLNPALILADAHIMLGDMARLVDAGSAADLPTALATMQPWPPAARKQPEKHPFVAMMLPSLERGFERHYEALARRRLAATALAIRWYALDHAGQFPAQLQQLVPQYLPALPSYPMAVEAPLIYIPDQAILYSIGIDGQDDGGDTDDGDHRAKDIVVPLR